MNEKLLNMGSMQGDSRDEDLALFHDMRRRERRNFLYSLKDDIDASPRHEEGFSTLCWLAPTSARSGHDLLPLDSEKNDYDWLLTPPSTPLFPSLDQDVRIVNLSQRRILTRSTSVSKAARLAYPQEPLPQLNHGGNPSPRHPSTVSSTSSSINTKRGRPLSPSLTNRSSCTVRSSSPCRPTTPTGRNTAAASRLASRSLTPTLRRNHTSPSSANRVGPTNRRSRGKSLSPKLGPWEPSLPGFSAEPPPNLRTSLSDRTIQRGLSQTPRNGVRNRGSFAETASGGSRRSLGSADSFDGDGNWSLSCGNDRNSSQTSRASVVSSCDDDVDMAESVLSCSTRTSFDGGPKSANTVVTKFEDSSSRRNVPPAKRQMKPAGALGDPAPFLSASARKSYERQAAQRRSAQTMFRPLLSSAPITSFYSTRADSIHTCSASPFVQSPSIQNGRLHLHRSESLHGEIATEEVDSPSKSEDGMSDPASGQEIVEGEAEIHSHLEEKGLNFEDKQGLKNVSDVGTSREENESAGTPKEANESASCNEENFCAGVCLQPAQPSEQGHLHNDAGQVVKKFDNKGCDMDADLTGSNIFNTSETTKVKEHLVDDHKPATLAKPHAHLGAVGNVGSQHGAQRVLSDLGSFRRQSPMKSLNTRSHDGSCMAEKTTSCDSFTSDSHRFIKSIASALNHSEPLEASRYFHQGDAMEEEASCGSTSVCNRKLPCSENDGYAHSYMISAEVGNNISDRILDPDSCSKGAQLSHYSHVSQVSLPEDGCEVSGFINSGLEELMPEVVSGKLRESGMSDANEKLTQQDVASFFGSCISSIPMLEDSSVQNGCAEALNTAQSRRFSDALPTTSRLAADASEGDYSSQGQVPDMSLLKRSVTLEEATDTILFCSSIIHELVYKSATLAIENEEQSLSKPLVSKRDFVTLFGFSGADHKSNAGKTARPRDRKQQSLDTAVSKSSLVQKQRMVHRRTPAVTMRQSPMDRIENAVMGNHEEIREPIVVAKLPKSKVKQGKSVHCRCSCCMM